MIQASLPVLLAARDYFAGNFNAKLAQVCDVLDIDPFEINFLSPGVSYFEGPINLDFLLDYLAEREKPIAESSQAPCIPAFCLFFGPSAQQSLVLNNGFSGRIELRVRIFLQYPPDTINFETLAAAVETTMVELMQRSDAASFGAGNDGGTYNDDLQVDPGELVYENGSIYRAVEARMSFTASSLP